MKNNEKILISQLWKENFLQKNILKSATWRPSNQKKTLGIFRSKKGDGLKISRVLFVKRNKIVFFYPKDIIEVQSKSLN